MTYARHEVLLSAGQAIRLSGRNLTETDEVKLGAYHTLELEPQRAFTLAKARSGLLPLAKIKCWHPNGCEARFNVTEELLATPFCDWRVRDLDVAECHDAGLN